MVLLSKAYEKLKNVKSKYGKEERGKVGSKKNKKKNKNKEKQAFYNDQLGENASEEFEKNYNNK